MGGAEGLPSTKRSPAQTAGALFWACDGVNLIGTPLRLCNQIIRQVAYDKATGPIDSDMNNAEFAWLLALVNVAMADAGIFCWREKYYYELWRPLSGVRQDPTGPVSGGFGHLTWKVLEAPATNSNEGGLKSPFPAYPSGHATFGAAAFQIVRRFYHARDGSVITPLASAPESSESGEQKSVQVTDSEPAKATPPETDPNLESDAEFHGDDLLRFRFVSDELNGISREVYQPYDPSQPITDQVGDVQTRMVFTFNSMKQAIITNAISRIWLRVHWHFDAFAGEDVMKQFKKSGVTGKDTNPQRHTDYEQLYQCEADGPTKYLYVKDMDWFHSQAPREGDAKKWWYGGAPLGMLIADDIFSTGMNFIGSLENLSQKDPKTRA